MTASPRGKPLYQKQAALSDSLSSDLIFSTIMSAALYRSPQLMQINKVTLLGVFLYPVGGTLQPADHNAAGQLGGKVLALDAAVILRGRP